MSALLRANGIDPASDEGARIIAAMGAKTMPPEAWSFLVSLAVRVRLMGVAWTWRDLAEMRPFEREACLVAGEHLAAGSALMAGQAASGPVGRAGVAETIDGGAAKRALAPALEAQAIGALRAAARGGK